MWLFWSLCQANRQSFRLRRRKPQSGIFISVQGIIWDYDLLFISHFSSIVSRSLFELNEISLRFFFCDFNSIAVRLLRYRTRAEWMLHRKKACCCCMCAHCMSYVNVYVYIEVSQSVNCVWCMSISTRVLDVSKQ